MTVSNRPTWVEALDRLLQIGAALIVIDPDGITRHHSPLARSLRWDDADPEVVWIRPIFSRYTDPDGVDAFPLGLTRRRALHVIDHAEALDDTSLTLDLITGQRARIILATGEAFADLQAWDSFTAATLTQDERDDLAALSDDSWHGRYN